MVEEREESLERQPEDELIGENVSGNGEEQLAFDQEQLPEEKILSLEAELAQLKMQSSEYYEHLQRLQADFDNYRKRTQKEKQDLVQYAASRVVEAMLPMVDNFERAIASAQTNQDFEAFAQGVEMIYRQVYALLEQEGLRQIEAAGLPFDPKLHEAIMQVESAEYPENTIIEELQKGYYLKDKVLRPSIVKVSR